MVFVTCGMGGGTGACPDLSFLYLIQQQVMSLGYKGTTSTRSAAYIGGSLCCHRDLDAKLAATHSHYNMTKPAETSTRWLPQSEGGALVSVNVDIWLERDD